jgi:hypothetical protein
LVTAEHVVAGLLANDLEIWVRVNMRDGQTQQIKVEATQFRFHPNNAHEPADVPVCPIRTTDPAAGHVQITDTLSLPLNGPSSWYPTSELAQDAVKVGNEIAIVGLFRSHYGAMRIVPIVRAGNIAAMPEEPVHTRYGGMHAYLIEARSIGGLSGSPVFAMIGPEISMINALASARGERIPTQNIALLGLVHGHFDVPNLNEDVAADDAGRAQSIHTGIGVVVPVAKILETVQHPNLSTMRKEAADELRTQGIRPIAGGEQK